MMMLPLSTLVINILASFFNCCNALCSFFVKTDLLRLLFRMVETTLPRIRSASLGIMPRNPSSTEARILVHIKEQEQNSVPILMLFIFHLR